jgi:biopolymer transport protein ExbB/TolQ
MLSASLIGAGLGLVAALVSVAFLRALSARVDLPETRQALKVSGLVQLVALPLMGWFAGSYFGE